MRYLSIFEKDEDVLKAFNDIHLKGNWYDLDCTYSKGVFYKNIDNPNMVSDLVPLYNFVSQDDTTKLTLHKDNSLDSIVFDPPFLFRNRKSVNNDKISKRFNCFMSYKELLDMYKKSIIQFLRALKPKGYLFFKCQDMTDGKFYCTHKVVIDICEENGFVLKDIALKINKNKLQRDAKQQNCVAKVHSFWLVLYKRDQSQDKESAR